MRRLDLRKAQAARLSTIRDINRQIVLNYVREREPISRAEIARETDLQRSTISVIVEYLYNCHLIKLTDSGNCIKYFVRLDNKLSTVDLNFQQHFHVTRVKNLSSRKTPEGVLAKRDPVGTKSHFCRQGHLYTSHFFRVIRGPKTMKKPPAAVQIFLLALLILTVGLSALAQSNKATIVGTVRDPNEALVTGAKVTVTNLATGEPRGAETE